MAIDTAGKTSITIHPPAEERRSGFVGPARRDRISEHEPPGGDQYFGNDGLSFADLIDVVNPLQHIPIVSSIYRALSGDEISPAARMAGGVLFGGVVGLAASAADAIVEEATGNDIGGNMIAALTGSENSDDNETTVAAASADESAEQVVQQSSSAAPPATAEQVAPPTAAPQKFSAMPASLPGMNPSALAPLAGLNPAALSPLPFNSMQEQDALSMAVVDNKGKVANSRFEDTRRPSPIEVQAQYRKYLEGQQLQ